jgi:hypothetical protein
MNTVCLGNMASLSGGDDNLYMEAKSRTKASIAPLVNLPQILYNRMLSIIVDLAHSFPFHAKFPLYCFCDVDIARFANRELL